MRLALCMAVLSGINAKMMVLEEGSACRGGGVETGPKFDYSALCPDGTECRIQEGVMGIGGEVADTCQALQIADGAMVPKTLPPTTPMIADGTMVPETLPPIELYADGVQIADGVMQEYETVDLERDEPMQYADGAMQGYEQQIQDGAMPWNDDSESKDDEGGDGAGAEFDLEATVVEILKSVGLTDSQTSDFVAKLASIDVESVLTLVLAGGTPDLSKLFENKAFAAAVSDTFDDEVAEAVIQAAAAYSGPESDDEVIMDGVNLEGDDDEEDSSYFLTAGLVSLAAAALAASSF